MITVWLSTTAGALQLARCAVAQTLRCEEGEVRLGRAPGGRPIVLGVQSLNLAISHTRDVAAVALTRAGPVGVDIEQLRELPGVALARHWFASREAEWIVRRPQDFLHLWTQKEAVGKALGIGLRGGGLRRLMPLPPSDALTEPVAELPSMRVASWVHGELVLAIACDAGVDLGSPEIRTGCPPVAGWASATGSV